MRTYAPTKPFLHKPNKVEDVDYNFNQKPVKIQTGEEFGDLVAQAAVGQEGIDPLLRERQQRSSFQNLTQEGEDDTSLNIARVSTTPFQMFIDKAVEVLESISALDFRVNDLTEQYIQGKVSLDEISIETMKLNLSVSFVTTILSSGTQAFKDITQLAI